MFTLEGLGQRGMLVPTHHQGKAADGQKGMVSLRGSREEGQFGEGVQSLAVLNILAMSREEKPARWARLPGSGGTSGRPGSHQPALPFPSGATFGR